MQYMAGAGAGAGAGDGAKIMDKGGAETENKNNYREIFLGTETENLAEFFFRWIERNLRK